MRAVLITFLLVIVCQVSTIGCYVSPPTVHGTPVDRTLILKVGSSIETFMQSRIDVSNPGKVVLDVSNPGKVVYHSGDTLAWLAVIGNAYHGQELTVEFVDLATGQVQRWYSDTVENPPAGITVQVRSLQYQTITLPTQPSRRGVIMRLHAGPTVREKRLVFAP